MANKVCLVTELVHGSETMGEIMLAQVRSLLSALSNRERVHTELRQFVLNGRSWMAIRHTGRDENFEVDMANVQCVLMDSLGMSFEASDYITPYGQPRYLITPGGDVKVYVHQHHSLLRQLPFLDQEQIDLVLPNRGHGHVRKTIKTVVMVGETNAVCNVNRYTRYHVNQKLQMTPEILDGMVERKNGFQSNILVITSDNRVLDIAHAPSIPAPSTRDDYARRRLGFLVHGYTEVVVQRRALINDFKPLGKWDHFGSELHHYCNTYDGIAYV